MNAIRKAVITAAAPHQRHLPLQTLVDGEGQEKPLLRILVEEVLAAQIEEIYVVLAEGDEDLYGKAAGDQKRFLRFVPQRVARGYGHAVFQARPFVGDQMFLHLVGDHVYVHPNGKSCASQLMAVAAAEACTVSAVQLTREHLLSRFGAVGGQRLPRAAGLYRVETVLEKPTPTEAEQFILVPGVRAGHYLCYFGMHVLTPSVLEILARQLTGSAERVTLSAALAELATREQYLALETHSRRYDLGNKYGLLVAQLAVALNGHDRSEVMAQLVELVATSGFSS